ncbi:hypothetical protein AB4672_21575 [Bacillus paralicheniformis]|uniref:hypothetical protein n=1 Tax=Bacillus paralicheniformis TaxID=1648923 RepID=UPI0034D2D550
MIQNMYRVQLKMVHYKTDSRYLEEAYFKLEMSTIPEDGKKNMAVLNAMAKIKRETGLDLYKFDEDINEKAEVNFIK